MSDNFESGGSRTLILPPAAAFPAEAEADTVDRRRRDLFRRAAVTAMVIPSIGAMVHAADDKKKTKAGARPAAGAKHGGSAKPATAHGARAQSVTAHGGGAKSSTAGGVNGNSTSSRGELHSRAAGGTSASQSPVAQRSSATNRNSVTAGSSGARPAWDQDKGSKVSGGTPLREIYKDWNLHNFDQIQADENAHVAFLVNALGSYARPIPVFQDLEQPTVHAFATIARALENTGVGAYLGALPVLASTTTGQQYLAAAGSIALVEARHAGYLNTLLDLSLDENIMGDVVSLDVPLTPQQVVSLASPFIADLNGGPPLIPATGFTNPLDLLNFALALEYLEATFYNINVPNLKKTLAK